MKNVKVLGLIATLLVFAFCISSCKQTGAGGIESSGKKEVTFSIEQKDLVTKSTKSATIKADAKYVVVSIANDAGLVYDTKRLDLYNFSGSFISEPISLDLATAPYKVTKFLVLDANNVVIYATPLEGSSLAPMVDDPLPINFKVSKDEVTKVVPQVLATESIPVKDFGYVAFDFDVMASPLYFRTCVQIYNPATANWILTTADITITGTPGDVALYNNPIAAITDIIRVSDAYTNYKISVSKTGYATKEILLTNAQLKAYMENPLIVLLIEPGVVVPNGYGLLYNWYTTQPQSQVQYGYLYNWYAKSDIRSISSSDNWVTPTYALRNVLNTFLESNQGEKLKETGTVNWADPNSDATNEVGFNARGSGQRNEDGGFIYEKVWFLFWMEQANSTDGFLFALASGTSTIQLTNKPFNFGASVRLVNPTTTLTNGQTGTYTGNDGKVYKTICIGTQEWISSNLAETKYRDGSSIPEVTDNTAWAALTTGGRCSYNNVEANAGTTAGIAPAGWHVPTYNEVYTILVGTLGGQLIAGGKLKEIGLTHWNTPNTGADNSSGFNGIGSGYRNSESGSFDKFKTGLYIIGTNGYGLNVMRNSAVASLLVINNKYGYSVRLIKNDSSWTAGDNLTDIDGNVYPTVKIGDQVWTASNWKCTKYNDGTPIPNVTDNTAWSALTTGAWCVYDNDINNK